MSLRVEQWRFRILKSLPPTLKTRAVLAAIITALYILFILPITERVSFNEPEPNNTGFMVLLKVGFMAFFFLVTYGLLSLAKQIKNKDKFTLSWMKFTGLYGLVALAFFLLMYPGHWVWDEFNILYAVQHYIPDAWQNIYTNIYYTFCLYIIPTGVSIVFFQGIIASLVVGYVLARVQQHTKSKLWIVLLFLVFVMPPVIINNLYPLRLTVYSYIEVLFLVRLLFLLLKRGEIKNSSLYLLQMTGLVILLAFWRSEGIYYLLTLPIISTKLGLFSRKNRLSSATLMLFATSIVMVVFGYTINRVTSNDRYALTAMINPLSVMIQSPLRGDNVNQRLSDIDKVIDIDMLKKYPSYTEIPAFWAGAVRDNYQEGLALFKKQYLVLVVDNFDLFIDARIKTFMATNGFDTTTPTPLGMLSFESYSDPHSAEIVNRFYKTNLLSRPINKTLKREVTRSILMLDNSDRVSLMGRVFWSVIPVSIIVFMLLSLSVMRRHWEWVLIFALIVARLGILFITAPAHYFMYYLPVYISGACLSILWLSINFRKQEPTAAYRRASKHSK